MRLICKIASEVLQLPWPWLGVSLVVVANSFAFAINRNNQLNTIVITQLYELTASVTFGVATLLPGVVLFVVLLAFPLATGLFGVLLLFALLLLALLLLVATGLTAGFFC